MALILSTVSPKQNAAAAKDSADGNSQDAIGGIFNAPPTANQARSEMLDSANVNSSKTIFGN